MQEENSLLQEEQPRRHKLLEEELESVRVGSSCVAVWCDSMTAGVCCIHVGIPPGILLVCWPYVHMLDVAYTTYVLMRSYSPPHTPVVLMVMRCDRHTL